MILEMEIIKITLKCFYKNRHKEYATAMEKNVFKMIAIILRN